MRQNAAEQTSDIVAKGAVVPLRETLVFLTGLVGALLTQLLMSHAALAEPAALASPAYDEGIAVRAEIEAPSMRLASDSFDPLLEILGLIPFRSQAEIADESLVAAVARGSNPEFERASSFRKRSSDLFQAERQVEIGEQEMLIRLRVRPQKRKAMSVELHF